MSRVYALNMRSILFHIIHIILAVCNDAHHITISEDQLQLLRLAPMFKHLSSNLILSNADILHLTDDQCITIHNTLVHYGVDDLYNKTMKKT